jgi:transposase-like protein
MFKGLSIYEFRERFTTQEDCLSYLFDLKWSKGFVCTKCSNTSFYKGRTKWYRKCQKCSFDESVKSNTLFHNMKVPILKAFEILFMIGNRKKGMSTLEISKTYELNKDTAWLLKRKAQQGMFSSGKNKLKGKVHVDEFAVGGKEKGKQGRSGSSKKTKVILACEVIKYKGKMTLGNAYAKVIDNYSTEELRPIFEQKIDVTAKVKTDKWKAYQPISKDFEIEQIKSEGGVNFKELNTLTMLFKGWIRGIHHKVSKENMQHYIDEFFFKFNRKAHPKASFNKMLENFMSSKPLFIQLREGNG